MIAVETKIVKRASSVVELRRDKDDPLYWQMRRENDEFLRRQQWWWHHYTHGTLKNNRQLEAQRLSRDAERIVANQIRELGYRVNPTTHKSPFDLWVENDHGQAAKVEVKISLFHRTKKGGRYQADLVVFIARNGQDWNFVIPMADIAPRQNIAIWSACPADYAGQWAPYLENWDHLHTAVESAVQQVQQPALF